MPISFVSPAISVLIFILGASLGSFLNVVILRLPKGEDIFKKRSYCPACKIPIKIFDLIPIVSYLILGGKCRNCGKKISPQYPLVETTTATLFLASFLFWKTQFGLDWQFLPQLAHYFVIISILICVFAIDAKLGIIPDQIIKFAVLSSFFLVFVSDLFNFSELELLLLDIGFRILAGFAVFLFFATLILVTGGRGMGWGDVKLGFWLGFIFSLPQIFLVLFLSFLTGAAVSIVLIAAGLKKFGQTIAFGPFLAIGAAISLFLGDSIISWYLRNLG